MSAKGLPKGWPVRVSLDEWWTWRQQRLARPKATRYELQTREQTSYPYTIVRVADRVVVYRFRATEQALAREMLDRLNTT